MVYLKFVFLLRKIDLWYNKIGGNPTRYPMREEKGG